MKTLIEKILPVEEISEEAKKEKKGRPPTFEMHYWWTRKPLVTARAVVLGSLLPENFDIDEFKQLLGLGRRERAFKYNLMDEQIKNLHQYYKQIWGTETPTVFDPFAGGGSIPFDALRVGCNIVANDYNPVAWLIMKSVLEYPIKYDDKLVKYLKKVFDDIFKKLKAELGDLYPTHNGKEVAAYIYAWMVKCPKCGFETPLVGSWWLARKKNKPLYLQYIIKDSELHFEIERGENIRLILSLFLWVLQ
jgi:Adenine-specific DNA methylase containing a Zn-ribbon